MTMKFRLPAAAVTALALLAGGGLSALPAPAHAAATTKPVTRYAFNTAAYGTRVVVRPAGLTSGDTAHSMIGCTRIAGLARTNNIAGVNFPGLVVGAATSRSFTFKDAASNIGDASTSDIASLTLGSGATSLVIKGLHGESRAWHRPGHGFAATNTFDFVSATMAGTPVPTGAFANQGVLVPGVGQVTLGQQMKKVTTHRAWAGAASLRIRLFGPDATPGTADDTVVLIGSTVAQVAKGATQGVMTGEAYGLHVSALGGAATSQQNILLPLGCTGTGGKTITRSLASWTPSGQLTVSGLSSSVYGIQNKPVGGLTAKTWSKVAGVNLGGGQLIINGVLGWVKVYRKHGIIHRVPRQTVLSIKANGQTYPAPALGQSLTIPGVASITAPPPISTKHGMRVVALRVDFLPGTAGETRIDLGTAWAEVKKK